MVDFGAEIATRTLPLAGAHGGSSVARLELAAPAERISLRVAAADVAALSAALGVDLPTEPKTSASANGRTAMWLGPDEWLVIADGPGEIGSGLMAEAAKASVPHSAADVSHRNTAILVSGPGAAATINTGCPQDLSLAAFPVGACSRTIFGKVEIVLLRTAEDVFRVEVWRSFSTYAFGLLAEGAGDAAL
ncbi:sarcosine oxidase subunit gamma family protein [Rhizobiales bacterium RZME27]|jgi:sarcosine oxidase subunit gamma|uniref:Sarcosine oxidase subunit gamma family protein n=1 Tax=Endobacterium cereale TaxID=2663029 RepID=A0A6A8ABS8_9HYPH|nr:sarcosine oxidase subunit gamma [Endobacterium cereale]MEB2845620.1 sarcosine oxidase subunit gamma [Endobacterium cereale]MQY48753.1 sarcosine oxidase subunit gamma family protein [Endobacterium cereale]